MARPPSCEDITWGTAIDGKDKDKDKDKGKDKGI